MSRRSGPRDTTWRMSWRVWGWPIALGAASAAGLVAALVGDGAWDAVSWITLAAPVVVTVLCVVRRPVSRQT